ncbi:MAG TPA: pyrroline-5-carboxylate reductase [Candidatus Korarchaeota archaeon]|nr:pyrroline-5-carboxylate reductase [Candidatus Korarchaeota archaeon]
MLSGSEKRKRTIAIIGAGQVGSATAQVLAKSGKWKVIATRRHVDAIANLERLGVRISADNIWAARQADVIILAVKPTKAVSVLREIAEEICGKLVISFVAAITLDVLKSVVPKAEIIRAMPNIALMVKESFTAYSTSNNVSQESVNLAEEILAEFGEVAKVDESLMDAVTGLSGSGPAYAATFIEALAYAGLKVGLSRQVALRSAARTLLGTAKLVLDLDLHPSKVKEMVITPGGTTIEGIYHIEESGIRSSVMKAVDAASRRCKEITNSLKKAYKENKGNGT